MIKQRTMVHIALNSKNECVDILVATCGRLIPFNGDPRNCMFEAWRNRRISQWLRADWATEPSVKEWKQYCKEAERAVRFQRVMLIGGAA